MPPRSRRHEGCPAGFPARPRSQSALARVLTETVETDFRALVIRTGIEGVSTGEARAFAS